MNTNIHTLPPELSPWREPTEDELIDIMVERVRKKYRTVEQLRESLREFRLADEPTVWFKTIREIRRGQEV